MTNKQALVAMLQVSVPDTSLDLALINAEVDPEAEYVSSGAAVIARMAVGVLMGILSTPDISEGGFSINYDRAAIQARVNYLSTQYKLQENIPKPSVKSRSVW